MKRVIETDKSVSSTRLKLEGLRAGHHQTNPDC